MFLMPLLMFLPLLALPIFWLMPLAEAIPIYLCIVAISAGMFFVMRRTMKLPATTGAEYLIGQEAEVVSGPSAVDAGAYLVRLDGELWSAQSSGLLEKGERVLIVGVRSNTIIVKRNVSSGKRQEPS